MTKEFKVGDIVYYKAGRICNGKYGVIDIGPYEDLSVLDNEGAPHMEVKGNEELLEIVGNTKDNPELLNEWTYQSSLYGIEDLRKVYIVHQENLTTNFDTFLEDAKKNMIFEIRQEAFENKVIKEVKNIFPDYTYDWVNAEDGGRILRVFNVEADKDDKCYDIIRDIMDTYNPKYEFDTMLGIKTIEITERYYPQYSKNKENK